MTVVKGGTVGTVVPSLTASYAKFGNLVHLTFMFWGGTIAGANSDGLILKLPLPASTKTERYYGHIGYSNAGVTDIYTVISANNATLANQIAFVNHNASGSEVSVSGTQMNTRTVQGDIWYFTE